MNYYKQSFHIHIYKNVRYILFWQDLSMGTIIFSEPERMSGELMSYS